ncbi:GlxA family transcriptional regulator [Phytoactinopolyspora halotolerans]|uniref:GlxA family transcriptional regulator n=1 Tax=Phytoactinopolyspora halotolerans TaxID=1981512 RepID=A0A6L9SDX9_9ACTN|nr:GlxA family transcriptional regulator [Phytoactinopolyspora halotolerans]NEE03249.1 GlxA family transcriptional regulator [Phytoactinopolyspora halotolerans]
MEARQILVVAYEHTELVDVACVTTCFDMANRLGAAPPYRVRLVSPGGGSVRCDSGLELQAQGSLEETFEDVDTIIVSGGLGHEAAAQNPQVLHHVRRLAGQARRTASVCTGATVLAATGLLDGRTVTTHWWYARRLARLFPKVNVDAGPVYIRDGDLATSGGVTASLDLTLAFIEEDHGAELARHVALGVVTYLQRPGNQAQMSLFTTAPRPDHVLVRSVLDHVVANITDDLSTSSLAARAGVSVRHLTRLFREHLGEPPAKAVQRIRLEMVARLLTSTELSMSQVAKRAGFSSAETMRQAYVNRFGITPSQFRSTQSVRHTDQ